MTEAAASVPVVRRTIVVSGSAAGDTVRIALARAGLDGTQVTSAEGLAARLAGGFLSGIDGDVLHGAVAEAINDLPAHDLGDLAGIAALPGLSAALSGTLAKAWRAGMDLSARVGSGAGRERLAALGRVEEDALSRLPAAMRRPSDLVAAAMERLHHAAAVLGEVEFRAVPDLDPCWRPLAAALARTIPTRWTAGPRAVPEWVRAAGLKVATSAALEPRVSVVSCASARHEVMEALRWARALLADGVPACEVGIAAAAPGDFDDLVLSLAAEASLDVHFGHGRRALTSRDGQTCAALADALSGGPDRDRVRRLVRSLAGNGTSLGGLPPDWTRHMPRDAPLQTAARWRAALAAQDAPADVSAPLLAAVELLQRGLEAAGEAGESLLRGAPRLIWRRALMRGPAAALEASLGGLRVADGVEPETSIAWMHAAALASCPRPHVWLLGLNSRSWPRRSAEDPLLPDHVVPARELEPQSLTERDRASFRSILDTTAASVTCSLSRRDASGRLLGASALLPKAPRRVLYRARVPEHAMSEPDRMMARPEEFSATPRAASAIACWRDWHKPRLTPHDGLVRPDHPAVAAALARVQSASSLALLLRNPLGFVWKYGLGWRAPDGSDPQFDLAPVAFGTLVHDLLKSAVERLGRGPGLARASDREIAEAIDRSADEIDPSWDAAPDLPPRLLWEARIVEARELAQAALCWSLPRIAGQRTFAEIDFPAVDASAPWPASDPVPIPGTGLRIKGRIDRLDLSGDGRRARVVDYKTGMLREPVTLGGGRELQRCLYSFAVRALLGEHVEVEAALLYPRGGQDGYRPLADRSVALATLTAALAAAEESLTAGNAVLGPDAGGAYDDLAFALPTSPGSFVESKREAARWHLGEAASIWEEA